MWNLFEMFIQDVDLKILPKSTVFHFIGIDGIGMSSIARVLLNLGFSVQGSNDVDGENMRSLEKLGAKVFVGHQAKNVDGADIVVFSSAVPENNVEMLRAKELGLRIIERAKMLQVLFAGFNKSIAVCGTHGKTTTTAFVGTMLDIGGFDPTIIDGGIMNRYSSSARVGNGDIIVAEACEAFGNIQYYTTDVAVLTNVDAEHLEYYKTFDNVKKYFQDFLGRVTEETGLIVACAEHPVALELAMEQVGKKNILTYGFADTVEKVGADVMAENVVFGREGTTFDVRFKDGEKILGVHLPLFGRHNVLNALASISVAKFMGMKFEDIKTAVAGFIGTKHRFSHVADVNGVTIFDDYGHHPKEIEATLSMARAIAGAEHKVFAIFEPHRYSRLDALFGDFLKCFHDADFVICMPVFGAGESEVGYKNHTDFCDEMAKIGDKKIYKINKFDECAEIILSNAKVGDIIVSLGAGYVKSLIYKLPELIENK